MHGNAAKATPSSSRRRKHSRTLLSILESQPRKRELPPPRRPPRQLNLLLRFPEDSVPGRTSGACRRLFGSKPIYQQDIRDTSYLV
jgi:hypothetical protein